MIDCRKCKHCKVEEVSYNSTKTKVMCYASPLHPIWIAEEDTQCEVGCDDFKEIEKLSIKELVENKLKEIDAELATASYTERTIIWILQAVWEEVLTMIEEN